MTPVQVKCGKCGAGDLCGVEFSAVYDGVLFWYCPACGSATERTGFEKEFVDNAQEIEESCKRLREHLGGHG